MRHHAVILAAAVAWLISAESAEARLDILVDKATQRMLVMQNGYMRYIWPVSTGRDETATPNGVYKPQRLERNWFSNAYYNSPMPFSIFFHRGYAIHGSYAIDRLGGPASHGCVRLHPRHAELLFDMVQQEGPDQTTIEVTEQARPGEPPPPLAGREVAPEREITSGQGPYLPPALAGRETGPEREFASGRGPYLPPALVGRETGPEREFASGRGPYLPPALAGREIGPEREFASGRGPYLPPPRIIRYRETGDMPELPPPPLQRSNRPMVARNILPPKQPLALEPPRRRLLSDVRSPTSLPRAACGAGEADAPDCRPKPKVAEVSSPEPAPPPQQVRQVQAPPVQQAQAQPAQPAPAQQAQQSYGKLLPASCWSGGASRWRWWSSGQAAPCK